MDNTQEVCEYYSVICLELQLSPDPILAGIIVVLIDGEWQEFIETITNYDSPVVEIFNELPENGCYMNIADEAGTGPYYQVTFTTTADAMLENDFNGITNEVYEQILTITRYRVINISTQEVILWSNIFQFPNMQNCTEKIREMCAGCCLPADCQGRRSETSGSFPKTHHILLITAKPQASTATGGIESP